MGDDTAQRLEKLEADMPAEQAQPTAIEPMTGDLLGSTDFQLPATLESPVDAPPPDIPTGDLLSFGGFNGDQTAQVPLSDASIPTVQAEYAPTGNLLGDDFSLSKAEDGEDGGSTAVDPTLVDLSGPEL